MIEVVNDILLPLLQCAKKFFDNQIVTILLKHQKGLFTSKLHYNLFSKFLTMPTWNQIQSQLRSPNNPVVFIDVSVGTTVCMTQMFLIVQILRLCGV